ncbi:hypothetical protein PTSG_07627 [Salpingoeca rosetta]|uniref:Uncharacterized protein n=1 Tax=Salpingoeca rosetta (strain ATCC 50818 / BSB-021) TaxID=946362 RepID=F2UHB1_SALR5|nr:uncharacterized protein PTSG_07627 [Salpingoeca rosetta]EGD76510.1 hypothetical protein PTSG_07627 [Salpingoeca rosetta]|eukprot:XP_004991424.1 hypothetical protein PTSG_07627 [Salpingoeca rosetta]
MAPTHDEDAPQSSSWTDCFKSRTKKQWGQIGGAYFILYTFFACWMAMHMAIYVSTTPETCTFTNGGNVCIGEPRFSRFRRSNIRGVDESPKFECAEGTCTAAMELRMNRDFRFHQLDGDIQVDCMLESTELNVSTISYAFSNCQIPADDIEKVVTSATPAGALDMRSCNASQSVSMLFEQGAMLPFAYAFQLEVDEVTVKQVPFELNVHCTVTTNEHSAKIDKDDMTFELQTPF